MVKKDTCRCVDCVNFKDCGYIKCIQRDYTENEYAKAIKDKMHCADYEYLGEQNV